MQEPLVQELVKASGPFMCLPCQKKLNINSDQLLRLYCLEQDFLNDMFLQNMIIVKRAGGEHNWFTLIFQALDFHPTVSAFTVIFENYFGSLLIKEKVTKWDI